VIYRHATLSDVPAIFDCHRDAVFAKASTHYDNSILRAWSPGPTPERLRLAEEEIANQDIIHRVAEIDSAVVGFGIVVPKQGEFRALYVKSLQRKGVGQSLCASLLREARDAGCRHLELDASLNAVTFYRKMGATTVGPCSHELAGGIHMPALKMRFELP
jgi:putative acetyltransferase